MLKKDIVHHKSPLRLLWHELDYILPNGGLGAVLARAGVGKTAFIVQLALNTLLRSKSVLHISIDDPVKKVCLWYEELFKNITKYYKIKDIDDLWDRLLSQRFIMTFKIEDFSVSKLKERINDLTEQGIFMPQMVIIDGFLFDDLKKNLLELKKFAISHGINIWLTVLTHRHGNFGQNDVSSQFASVSELFEAGIQLQPDGKNIYIKVLKGFQNISKESSLLLDPTTMLIHK
mmetsp:Transcript_5041/g.2818  ORF Transcript_5041/g.2818 Transcript_5041/m.2818 type:complete len:232 (+) Transcript_5041:2438-3133(+)